VRYFRGRWAESHADWGASTWLWADDDDGLVLEQWEIYDGGQVLHYDQRHLVDEYGMLADQEVDNADAEELSESDYRAAIAGLRPINRTS
jgi:hypothetical protein